MASGYISHSFSHYISQSRCDLCFVSFFLIAVSAGSRTKAISGSGRNKSQFSTLIANTVHEVAHFQQSCMNKADRFGQGLIELCQFILCFIFWLMCYSKLSDWIMWLSCLALPSCQFDFISDFDKSAHCEILRYPICRSAPRGVCIKWMCTCVPEVCFHD